MKKKDYIMPEVRAIEIKPVRLLDGSDPVAIDPTEEGGQNEAESLDLSFDME